MNTAVRNKLVSYIWPIAELDLHRLLSKDEAFKVAMQDTLKRILSN